jgi:hypothetical protein
MIDARARRSGCIVRALGEKQVPYFHEERNGKTVSNTVQSFGMEIFVVKRTAMNLWKQMS